MLNCHLRQSKESGFGTTVLLAPWSLVLVILFLAPMLSVSVLSFFEWDVVGSPRFVGWHNYAQIFNDPSAATALKNTLILATIAVPLHLVFALALAMLLAPNTHWMRRFRFGITVPYIISGIGTLITWKAMFEPNYGVINTTLDFFGVINIDAGSWRPSWLASTWGARIALIIVDSWSIGGFMLILLGARLAIPVDLYECAEINGATPWLKFRYVTLPTLVPTLSLLFFLKLLNVFQLFEQPLIMTNGGPGQSTLTWVMYCFQQIYDFTNIGYACALITGFLMITGSLCLVLMQFLKKWIVGQ